VTQLLAIAVLAAVGAGAHQARASSPAGGAAVVASAQASVDMVAHDASAQVAKAALPDPPPG
jgi:hypothetical protein